MPHPKKRHTKSRRNKRRSHQALSKINLSLCSKCKEPVLPHRVCLKCGSYSGRQAIEIKERKKREKKKKKNEGKNKVKSKE